MRPASRTDPASGQPLRRRALTWATLAVIGLIWFGRRTWLTWIGRLLIVADGLSAADAVVPLAGGGVERVAHAAALLREKYADWLVTADMPLNHPGIRASYGELVRQEAVSRGVPEECILTAPGTAETTYQEAMAICQLAQERGWRSLIVVTDPYHTRRARAAFRLALRGTGIRAMVRPVVEQGYRADAWWQSRRGVRETATEYLKWAMHVVGYR